uniref:Uncharacterized protein n=1 Tax=Trichogramma kaykai TaxID=54128 RepID=A0ABD2WHZ0_9HYME
MSEDIDMVDVNICFIEDLKSLRINVNWDNLRERLDLLEKIYLLIRNWEGALPNLLDIFCPAEIECLLSDAVQYVFVNVDYNEAVLLFIRFVVATGYKDEPNINKYGKPLLNRTTPVHREAERNNFIRGNVIYELFNIYNSFEMNYTDELGFSHFHVACKYGYVDLIEKFLEIGQDPNCLGKKTGDTPLHVALYSKKKEVIELLLRNGADPTIANIEGVTPFHVICQQHYDNENWARTFLQTICDVGLQLPLIIDAPNKSGQTPLHMAVYRRRKGLVELLLSSGVDPNLTDAEGLTALHIICNSTLENYNLTEMFFKICDEKHQLLRVNAQDKEGNTPLIWAMQRQNRKVMELLLRRGADPTLANSQELTPLKIVCRRKDDDSAAILFEHSKDHYKSELVNKRDQLGLLPLDLAVDLCYPTMLELLLRHGANANLAGADGLTPLHVIAQRNYPVALAEKLLEPSIPNYKPPQVDARDIEDNTPLHLAMSCGNRSVSEYLLSKGANPNLTNSSGSTPLHLYCANLHFTDSWARSIFKISDSMPQKMQLDLRDKEGCTPLHVALNLINPTDAALFPKISSVAELLLKRGANATIADARRITPLHIICKKPVHDDFLEILFDAIGEYQQKLQINCQDNEGNTPLHLALDRDNKKLVELLLRYGADPNIANEDGSTCLHVICRRKCESNCLKTLVEICDQQSIKLQIDAVDKDGRRPLQMAVAKLWLKTVDILLDQGADLSTFVFPNQSQFENGYKSQANLNNKRLNFASGAMILVESLMKRGYQMEREDAFAILEVFEKYELMEKKAASSANGFRFGKDKSRAKEITIKPSLSLYDLIQLQPQEAAKRVTFRDYYEFSIIKDKSTHLPLSWEVHLCEKLSRQFYQWWSLDCFWEIIGYRLPLECTENILNNLPSNQDLWNICLAVSK